MCFIHWVLLVPYMVSAWFVAWLSGGGITWVILLLPTVVVQLCPPTPAGGQLEEEDCSVQFGTHHQTVSVVFQ